MFLLLYYKTIKFVFRIFLYFVAEMSTSFTSYTVQIISVDWLNLVTAAIYCVSFHLIISNILRRTMNYDISIGNNLDFFRAKMLKFFVPISQAVLISTTFAKFSKVETYLRLWFCYCPFISFGFFVLHFSISSFRVALVCNSNTNVFFQYFSLYCLRRPRLMWNNFWCHIEPI
jgi:hypothetical protein